MLKIPYFLTEPNRQQKHFGRRSVIPTAVRDSPYSQQKFIFLQISLTSFPRWRDRTLSAKFLKHFFMCFLFLFLENLAFNKPTNMISKFRSHSSDRAVDGDSQTAISQSSCIHSRDERNPWWRVDLGQVEPVNEVYIVNRGDCCGDRLNPFEIRVGKTKLAKFWSRLLLRINGLKRMERNSQNRERPTNIVLHLITNLEMYLAATPLSPYI